MRLSAKIALVMMSFVWEVVFKKRVGEKIEISTVEKQFVLKDKVQLNRYEEVLSDIHPEYILLALFNNTADKEIIQRQKKNGSMGYAPGCVSYAVMQS